MNSIQDYRVPLNFNRWFQFGTGLITLSLITLGLGASGLGGATYLIAYIFFFLGIFFLAITEFGNGTVTAFRRTRRHINKYKRLDAKFQDAFLSELYCARLGFVVAAIDHGMADKVRVELQSNQCIFWRVIIYKPFCEKNKKLLLDFIEKIKI